MEAAESTIALAVTWLKLLLELAGAAFVGIGGISALVQLIRSLAGPEAARFTPVRLLFAKYLSLALEFQLGADVLATTLSPSWQQLAQLGAIAVIRTGLNYFLSREMREEKETIAAEAEVRKDAAAAVA